MEKRHFTKIGDKFGTLSVTSDTYQIDGPNHKVSVVDCVCDCGIETTSTPKDLHLGRKKFCSLNCVIRKAQFLSDAYLPVEKQVLKKDDRFGKWLVIGEPYLKVVTGKKENSKTYRTQYVKCKCDCGKIKDVCCSELIKGHTKGCMCIASENMKKRRRGTIAENGIKKCARCYQFLDVSFFANDNLTVDSLCATCNNCNKDWSLRHQYGISLEEYNLIFEKQGFVCGCCGSDNPLNPKKNSWNFYFVDHDHETGKVRGLLCFKCNVGIAHLGDDLEGIEKAKLYLEKSLKGEVDDS